MLNNHFEDLFFVSDKEQVCNIPNGTISAAKNILEDELLGSSLTDSLHNSDNFNIGNLGDKVVFPTKGVETVSNYLMVPK